MLNTIKKNKKYIIAAVFVSLLTFLVFSNFVYAQTSPATPTTPTKDDTSWIQNKLILGLSWIIYAFVFVMGRFATYLFGALAQVSQYNNFINATAVSTGWVIVRDLCNMFFILVLLVIAFATILRYESYDAKKLLPKLLIMAVLINFSKTICGLVIDFSQVIMLTFVNGFASNNSINNLTELLGLKAMMEFIQNKDLTGQPLGMEVVAGLILALISSIVVVIVTIVLVVILVMRIVMLWIYVIFSPFAFFAQSFPAGQKYFSQWSDGFTKEVMTGPLLAFFIWLALSTAKTSANKLLVGVNADPSLNNGIISGLLNGGVFGTYLITLGLLVGGLIMTQKLGGAAGSAAGKGMAALQKGRTMATKAARTGAANTGRLAARNTLSGVGGVMGRFSKEGSATNRFATMTKTWGTEMKGRRKDEKVAKRQKVLEKMGMGKEGAKEFEKFMQHDNVKKISKAGRVVAGAGIGAVLGGGIPGAIIGAGIGGATVGRNLIGKAAKTIGGGKGRNEKIKNADEKKKNELEKIKSERANDPVIKDYAQYRDDTLKRNRAQRKEELEREEIRIVKEGKDKGLTENTINKNVEESHKEINKKWDGQDESAKTAYEKLINAREERHYQPKIDQVNQEHNQEMASIQGPLMKSLEAWGKKNEGYDPNHLVIAAAAKISKDVTDGEKVRDDAVTSTGEQLAKRNWTGVGGPSASDAWVFKALNDGTKIAGDALKNMGKEFQKLQTQAGGLSREQMIGVQSMKKLIASQLDSGKTLSIEMNEFKGILDNIDTKGADTKGRNKVEEFRTPKT